MSAVENSPGEPASVRTNERLVHTPMLALSLSALGVVFGDIGTSPLYALRECFAGEHAVSPTRDNVLGVLSLVFWALVVVVSGKYLQYVMRAENKGEGGILALMALAARPQGLGHTGAVAAAGLLGAGLLFGDGIITPAISVLSAMEGLKIAAPSFSDVVLPATVAILVALFSVQHRGTARVGGVFGPVLLVWFLVLAGSGLPSLAKSPEVLWALDPRQAVGFFVHNGVRGFLTLGLVFLVVTGGEALYADMGHFGLKPIRLGWYGLVLPSLLLNYFGQGALLLRSPVAIDNPFYRLTPGWMLWPMLLVATLATIIASQAVITGVFSLVRQASMFGYWPRVRVAHTSSDVAGQIYVPSVNWAMMVGTVVMVLGFGASTRLAAAYGIAVTATMVLTTLLAFLVAWQLWKWPLAVAVPLTLALLAVDLSFFSANAVKVRSGGWVPLAIAFVAWILMTSWHRGRQMLGEQVRENLVPLDDFWELMRVERPARVPGTAVFMTSNAIGTPPALLHNFMHNHVVHQKVILLTVTIDEAARVPRERRLTVEPLSEGFVRIMARFGFIEPPDVPRALEQAALPGHYPEHTTYFLGREAVISARRRRESVRLRLFSALSNNATNATDFFNLPPDRVIEIGARVVLGAPTATSPTAAGR